MDYSQLKINEVFSTLKTAPRGISEEEVLQRRKIHNLNKLPQAIKLKKVRILIHQFKSALVYVLLVAALVSFFTGEIDDMYIILAVLFINAGVGYWQEAKAEDTLDKLKEALPQQALVRRGGDIKNILAEYIVPGDILLLHAGDKVVADARIISTLDILVNESFLTGESRPVKKHNKQLTIELKSVETRDNMIYSGSVITYGQGEAVVTAIGSQTRLGSIATLVKATKDEPTPLQKRISRLANRLVVIIISIALAVFLIGVYRNYNFIEMFKIAVAVAVAAIPEALLIAITVILAIGMKRILRKKALVRQLLAAETLGSTSVICVDKTGTLTEGSMKVVQLVTAVGVYDTSNQFEQKKNSIDKLLDIALFCNDAVIENFHAAKEQWNLIGRPTDRSLLQLVLDNNIPVEKKLPQHPRLTYLPFDSSNKYMITLNRLDKNMNIVYLKGAPEIVLNFCNRIAKDKGEKQLSYKIKTALSKRMVALSGAGYRVLAGAYKKIHKSEDIAYTISPVSLHFLIQ